VEDSELEHYKDGCLAERERADQAEDELERIRDAVGAPDHADLADVVAALRRRDELWGQAHGELRQRLLRAEALFYLAWEDGCGASGQPYEEWLASLEGRLERHIEETI